MEDDYQVSLSYLGIFMNNSYRSCLRKARERGGRVEVKIRTRSCRIMRKN